MRRARASLAVAGAMVTGMVAGLLPGLLTTGSSAAAPGGAAPAVVAASHGHGGGQGGWTMQRRFAREVVKFKDKDKSPRAIEHVTELQYRLRWVGAFKGPITGYFGTQTRAAVRAYQKRVGLEVTGVANHKTWEMLIPATVKARGLIPGMCKNGLGWHICYDRYRHQVTLWKKGKLRNSWLVRGGDRGYETRVGDYHVFRRDKDHVSSIYGTPMPYSQFFSGGQAFHGSPFMMDPWQDHSHGCVNMYIEDARQLWSMTHNVRLNVHIRGQWDRYAQSPSGAGTARMNIFD